MSENPELHYAEKEERGSQKDVAAHIEKMNCRSIRCDFAKRRVRLAGKRSVTNYMKC